jgi:ATP-binding cassette subfamily B protein
MDNKIGFIGTLKTLFKYSKEIQKADPRKIIVTVIVYIGLVMSSILFEILLLRYIVDRYNDNFNLNHFTVIMFCLLIFQITVWLIESYYVQYFNEDSNNKVNQYFYSKLFKKIEMTPLCNFEDPKFYDEHYFIVNDVNNRINEFTSLLETFVSSLLMIITLSSLIVITDPIIFIFVAVPLVCEYIISPRVNKLEFTYNKEISNIKRRGDYAQRVLFLKDYAKEIRTTKIKSVILSQFTRFFTDMKQLIDEYGLRIGLRQFIVNFAFQIISHMGVIIYITIKVYNNQMVMANAIVIISTFNEIIYSLKNILDIYMKSMEQALYIRNMLSYIYSTDLQQPNQGGLPLPSKIETLKFRNVSFSYPNTEVKALDNISFTVHFGQRIAILGPNGAGKSTLIKLIMRLLQPTEGEILINGLNINEYDLSDYRKKISAVKQNFVIFAADLEQNILLKHIENDNDKLLYDSSIEKSGFLEKHNTLPKGSKTVLSKEFDYEGEVLSGGEKQKIAIARAIANKADILLMDEPTSALDPISENNFYQILYNNFQDQILFLVSHSFSLSKNVDMIFFFLDGKLEEVGSHNELIRQGKKYAEYFKIQSDYFNRV